MPEFSPCLPQDSFISKEHSPQHSALKESRNYVRRLTGWLLDISAHQVLSGGKHFLQGASLGILKRTACKHTAYKIPQARTSLFTAPLMCVTLHPCALDLFQLAFHSPPVPVFLRLSRHWLAVFPVGQGALAAPLKSADICPWLTRKTKGGEGRGHSLDPFSTLNAWKQKGFVQSLGFWFNLRRRGKSMTWYSQFTVIERSGEAEAQITETRCLGETVRSSSTAALEESTSNTHL